MNKPPIWGSSISDFEQKASQQVELQVLDQYWVLIEYPQPNKMSTTSITSNSNRLECYVDIESQGTARQTMERINRYIEAHYYDGEYTIISMCKL